MLVLFSKSPDWLWGPPSLLFNGCWSYFLSPPSTVEDNIQWSYASAPPIHLRGVSREIFTSVTFHYTAIVIKQPETSHLTDKSYEANNRLSRKRILHHLQNPKTH